MDSNKKEKLKLYKYKYVYQDRETYEEIPGTDWISLTQSEYDTYVVNYINTGVYDFQGTFFGEDYELVSEDFGEATDDELEAYNEGWVEATMLAQAQHRMDTYNGIAYRLDSMEPMETTKVFTCGSCDRQFEFTETAKFGDFYAVMARPSKNEDVEDVLWHVCMRCAND